MGRKKQTNAATLACINAKDKYALTFERRAN